MKIKFFFLTMAAVLASGKVTAAEQESTYHKIKTYLVDYEIMGFHAWQLATAAFIIMAALTLTTSIRYFLKKKQENEDKLESSGEKSLLGMFINCAQQPVRIVIWATAIRFLGPIFNFNADKSSWASSFVFSLAIALFLYKLIDIIEYYFSRVADRTDNKLDDMLVPVIRKTMKVLVIIVAFLYLYYAATGEEPSTLLAGLGLGGLAFALAAQDTLKNVFGFVMILTDRPFNIGERIDYAGHDGVVESVGFRSSRIRRLDGHQVIIPNSLVADSVIHNIGRRKFIRRVMNITITYDTPLEKVEKAVQIVKDILENHEGMNSELPPKVYFSDLNADSLNILAIYWYHPAEYWDYMEFSQKINFELMKRFEAEGIEFAFPTQTLYLAGDEKRKLVLENLNKQI